ncbi:YhcB family protein [Thalassotalea marina]|uniref:Z-ring associated protein G n=1 Tax=Thalassotalea marina TaxID=1673741 RepID=A0A919EG45_9GAMM|nr:insecticidal delta-endotoxin Cry8Ea1 family protein [Thalassotalea marina]GHF78764.1 hypothetical protein GCM10017161_02310 [Thalassotalea marina]
MDIVVGIIIFAVGATIGYVANALFSASSKENKSLAEKANSAQASLEQYKVDVAEHLDNSTKLLDQMNETCQKAMKQMEQSTKLLQRATPSEENIMPFFSKETQEQLAQTVALRHAKEVRKKDESITEAPLDYSGQASGLFADNTQAVTNNEKQN